MLNLQNTFKYQGDVKQSPFPRITLAAQVPVFEYLRAQAADVAVTRKAVASDRVEVEQDIGQESYRISAAMADLVGKDADSIRNFLAYTTAAIAARSINDLSFAIPVQFTSETAMFGGSSLQAIYLVKALRQQLDQPNALMFSKRLVEVDSEAVVAYLERNLYLVNRQAYDDSLAEFRKLTGRNDDWLLLSLIQRLVDEADLEPGSPFEFSKPLSAIAAKFLAENQIENREEAVRFIAKHFKEWFDFPILIPPIKAITVAGSLQVNMADGSSLKKDDLFLYDLSLEYSERSPTGVATPRVVHYDWKSASDSVRQNKAPFSFAGKARIFPANVTGMITVSVRAFDGNLLWLHEYDPNDPALKEVIIVVTQVRPTTLTVGAVQPGRDGKRLRGQVLELEKKCPLKDITVVIQAKSDGDELWRVVAAADTDASGNFSMPYPYGVFTKAQAILSLTPESPADIQIRDVGPNATISDDFLYLLMQDPVCPEADDAEAEDCDCDSPKKAPRLPGQDELINSSAYTQDIGGSCVNLSTPNRTLNEYRYTGIVRTSDPDVANYTLEKNSKDGSFALKGGQKRIVRSPVDLDNPIRWQDAPDFSENLTLYQSVTVATGHVLHYKCEFRADGYSLGNLLYSLGLAPGQKKQIVIMDSQHSLLGAESQNIVQGESLAASLLNERNVTDQISGNINEALRGSSSANTSGVSAGFGVAGSYGGMIGGALGVAGGNASSSASASQDSSRGTSMFFGEKLRQTIMQNAESYRQLNASVVTSVQEGQQYSVTTDVVSNHNHCHAVTMMYFEVLRHYAIFQELANVEECIFVPLLMTNFSKENIYKWADVLARNLLPMSSNTYLQPFPFLRYRAAHPLVPAFDANARKMTNYAFVDFPKGQYCAEPITSVSGYLTVRVDIPRPKTTFDRILSFPIVKREETHNANGGGVFGAIVDIAVGKNNVTKTWEEKEKIANQHIIIYDNFQEAQPADVIEVVNFDNFFEGSQDEKVWKSIADLCGYSDVQAFLANYFSHKTISKWDSTFNDEIAPKVVEALLKNSISIVPFSSVDFTPTSKYHGGSVLMRLTLRANTSLARNSKDLENIRINYSRSVINAADFWDFVTLSVENLNINYTTKHYEGYIINKYIGDDLFDNDGKANPPIPTPMNTDEQRDPHKEDDYLVLKLIEHLNSNLEHYNKTLWVNLDPDRRYMLLDGFNIQIYDDFGVPTGTRSLASVVKNELLTVTGNSLVFPVAAGYKVSQSYIAEKNQQDETVNVSLLDHYKPFTPVPPYRISVPSRGVFLEAVQGNCDACEPVKENSSQDWTKFQTDEPTPIVPVTTPVPTITDWKAAFKDFATPLINIQNAPGLPAPAAGLAGVTDLLGKAGVFKDVTGLDATQQNVIRTYLSNQENAKAFAEMAKSMVTQDHNTQHSDKIMDTLKTAKSSGAINQDDYGKLVKDHIQKQIDGGDAQARQDAAAAKQKDPSPIKSAVDLAQMGSKVKATESDEDGNTKTLDVDANPAVARLGFSIPGSIAMPITATRMVFEPVRADEVGKTFNTFRNGPFTIFVPQKVRATDDEDVKDPKVHVFFAAGAVNDDVLIKGVPHGNGVAVHGLRGASNDSEWITIAVRGGTNSKGNPITDAEIDACLQSVGISSPLFKLRLSGHSRGALSLAESLMLDKKNPQAQKIKRLDKIDRVHFLDEAVEHAGKTASKPGAITVNRVLDLTIDGIPAEKIVSYEVNNLSVDLSINPDTGKPLNKSVRVAGAKYFVIDSSGMTAVGLARVIADACVLNPDIAEKFQTIPVSADPNKPNLIAQFAQLQIPDRGKFSVLATNGQNLVQFIKDNAKAITTVTNGINAGGINRSVLDFANKKDVARELDFDAQKKPIAFQFSAGIAAHHFLVAEIAHELTE